MIYFNLRPIRALFAANGRPAPEFLPYSGDPQLEAAALPTTSGTSVVEILLACLAVLYILGSVCGVVVALIRFPLFFLGFILRGPSALVASLVYALIALVIGIGLLRRIKAAWIGALALDVLGLVSSVLFFLPQNRVAMVNYQREMMTRMFPSLTFPGGATNPYMQNPSMYGFSAFISVLTVAAVLWLLIRARPLFESRTET